LIIGPGFPEAPKADGDMLPPAVLAAALATLPHVLAEGGEPAQAGADKSSIELAARIARHDTFLPGFDLIMGNALAALLGRQAYLKPPLRIA
jgi:hypothetical protein